MAPTSRRTWTARSPSSTRSAANRDLAAAARRQTRTSTPPTTQYCVHPWPAASDSGRRPTAPATSRTTSSARCEVRDGPACCLGVDYCCPQHNRKVQYMRTRPVRLALPLAILVYLAPPLLSQGQDGGQRIINQ